MTGLRTGLTACAALAVSLGLATTPAQAKGSDISPQDMATLRGYVLTTDKFSKWATATAALKRDAAKDPSLRKEYEGNGSQPQTIAATAAMLKQHPRVAAYYRKAGLSDMDAVLMPMVALSASMATMVPPENWGQLPVTPAQINFMKAHQKEMRALSGMGADD